MDAPNHKTSLIPSPSEIRQRLSESAAETRMLRRLLKLAEDASIERNRLREQVAAPLAGGRGQ